MKNKLYVFPCMYKGLNFYSTDSTHWCKKKNKDKAKYFFFSLQIETDNPLPLITTTSDKVPRKVGNEYTWI